MGRLLQLRIATARPAQNPGGRRRLPQVVEINPRYAEAHNNLGYLLEGQGKVPEAIAELRKAIENSPGFPQAHFSLGRILVKQGNYEEGFRIC